VDDLAPQLVHPLEQFEQFALHSDVGWAEQGFVDDAGCFLHKFGLRGLELPFIFHFVAARLEECVLGYFDFQLSGMDQ
jgi:hypothetical protein